MLSGPVEEQVDEAVRLLVERRALDVSTDASRGAVVGLSRDATGPVVAVAVEPDRASLTAELLGAAAELASQLDGHVVALTLGETDQLGSMGADAVVRIDGALVEEDVAGAIAQWAQGAQPWAILLPSTTWGREVGGRAAARLDAGLTGDVVALEVSRAATTGDARLLAWKPAFGGRLVAAIYCSSLIQMATVRRSPARSSPSSNWLTQ